jgi:hypothetical protein
MGEAGLLDKDKYSADVNLEDLSSTTGETQEYWFLAVKAARKAYQLRTTWRI